MVRLLRLVGLIVISMLLIGGVVLGLGLDTGPVEKAVLVAIGAGLLVAAAKVNKIGADRAVR